MSLGILQERIAFVTVCKLCSSKIPETDGLAFPFGFERILADPVVGGTHVGNVAGT